MGDVVEASTVQTRFGIGGVEMVDGFVEEKVVEIVMKKRRGRPPKDQGKVKQQQMMMVVKENDGEDVCFICFDGGSLVLCDRRGCPKAYHPACIKRDEAFFQSAARWTCGWHICSVCQKSSHFMCYTCTFSLCKKCTKGADFLWVRENKGFCNICLNMVNLIENIKQENNETVQVDFDDKTSWEYLFKVYWIYLKTKLGLTFDELTNAKRVDMSFLLSSKGRNSDIDYLDEGQAIPNSKRRRTRRWSAALQKGVPQSEVIAGVQVLPSPPKPIERASKELLEFVSHMKKGDTSFLAPFDVQSLILEYIRINELRDPSCQSQIICDLRLRNLFGKARLGHIEMLKLVECHFQPQKDSPAESAGPVRRFDTSSSMLNVLADETNDWQLVGKDARFRDDKHDCNKGTDASCDGYAAIDVHNIKLVYLTLNLMEKLLVDEKFHEKAVGSVVRIKMSSSDQRQDMYRLVQVVGTIKVDEPYKVRNMLTSWKLEILNISKKEVIPIDEISDQEFSEDECKRFCQSIKYGLATRLKVKEILDKAMTLRKVKVADYLEREILRLSHLRDRACEKGQSKEFKDHVDKIELLNSHGERQRLENEVPEVHKDPHMNPRHQSEEDNGLPSHKKHGDSKVAAHNGMKRKAEISTYPLGIDKTAKKFDYGASEATEMSTSYKGNKKALTSMVNQKQRSPHVEGITERPTQSNDRRKKGNSSIQSKPASTNDHFVVENGMPHGAVRGTSVGNISAEVPSAGDFKTEKIWHYQDPSWNIQGPFSILQLRKWNKGGYFPVDLRIWKTGEKPDESILLTDALDGQFYTKPMAIYNICEVSIQSNASSDLVRSSCSSSMSTPTELAVNSREGQCANSMRSHESVSSYSQLSSSPSMQTLAGKACQALSLLAQECWDGPKCADKTPSKVDSLYPPRDVPNLNSEDLESPRVQKKEINVVRNSFAKSVKDTAADVPLIIPSVDSCRSSMTDSVPSNHQLNPIFNLRSIPMEISPSCSKQAVPYVLPVNMTPLPANPPHLANDNGQNEVVSNNQAVVGSDVQLPDAVNGWIGGSCLVNTSNNPPLMPNAWNANPLAGSMPKPNDLDVDITSTQPTTDNQDDPTPFQFWHSIFGEDDEFPFALESVSDLLAEVDAMECLNGPASPTSAMVQAAQFSQPSKEDSFAPNEGLHLTLDLTKGDGCS